MSGALVRLNNRRNLAFGFGGTLSRLNRSFNLRRALRTASQMRNRFGGSFTRTQQKRRTSGRGVTAQFDRGLIYRKRRMPRFRRRRWKNFRRKVLAVSEKDLGSRTLLYNISLPWVNTTPAAQGLAYISLYSGASADSWQADLSTLCVLENAGNPTAAAGGTVYDTSKFIFKSAILDVTFRNISGYNSGNDVVADPAAKLEVDVYEFLSGREWRDTVAAYSDITSALAVGSTVAENLGGTGTGITLPLRGVTPWDLPYGLGYFRMKIIKKTKYFLNNLDTFTYQIRDPKRRVITQRKMNTMSGGNLPKWSRHILIVFKLTPGLTVGSADNEYTERLACGITRKYFYKIEGSNDDRDQYLAPF